MQDPAGMAAFFGFGFVIDFCCKGCMLQRFRRGGVLTDGSVVLALYGRTPGEHVVEAARWTTGLPLTRMR